MRRGGAWIGSRGRTGNRRCPVLNRGAAQYHGPRISWNSYGANMMKWLRITPLLLLVLLSACSKGRVQSPAVPAVEDQSAASSQKSAVFDVDAVNRGAVLYQSHCAQCHGPQAQGHPDWKRGREEGFAAAPPLNGTGTDWQLSKRQMINIIRNGRKLNGVPVMPAWKGRVKDGQIEDIITWFQATWPADVYEKWRRANTANGEEEKPSSG
jgi:mono/diheme cytochrome c family protein